MAFSYVTDVGTGSKTSFTFAFSGQDEGYIREEDIRVYVDGLEVPFSLTSTNTLELQSAPDDGAEIIIRRVMPNQTPYADFSSGNNFGADVLNNSFLQLLYLLHELLDGWFPAGFTVREAVDYLEGLRSLKPDPNDPNSVVTFGSGDDRYVNLTGDVMQGSLNMDSYPVFVRIAVNGNEPARKNELDRERAERIQRDQEITSAYQAADSNIQSQLTGNVPLEASAFSPISWHDRDIKNSVIIPPGVNAWSFGPVVRTAEGQSVTISEGATWVIANGQGSEVTTGYDGGEL